MHNVNKYMNTDIHSQYSCQYTLKSFNDTEENDNKNYFLQQHITYFIIKNNRWFVPGHPPGSRSGTGGWLADGAGCLGDRKWRNELRLWTKTTKKIINHLLMTSLIEHLTDTYRKSDAEAQRRCRRLLGDWRALIGSPDTLKDTRFHNYFLLSFCSSPLFLTLSLPHFHIRYFLSLSVGVSVGIHQLFPVHTQTHTHKHTHTQVHIHT